MGMGKTTRKRLLGKNCTVGNEGSLTVECLLFLIPVMCAFFTLVNISRYVQAEVVIRHAITQTAKQISVYSYVLTKAKLPEKLQSTANKSDNFKKNTQETIDNVTEFMGAVGGLGNGGDIADQVTNVYDTGKTAYDSVTEYFSNPKELLAGVLAVAKAEGEQVVLAYVVGCIARGCIRESLAYMTNDPDGYLEGVGIVDGLEGLEFSQSRWMNNPGNDKAEVRVVATYKMKNLMFPQFDFGEHKYRVCAATSIW